MTSLWPAVLVSSLVGSLHCVAMCGPLIGLSGGLSGGLSAGGASLRLALVHALGRLATYATLGALAGAVGRAVDVAGHLAEVQRGAALIAGAAIVGWGVHAIAIARGWLRARPASGEVFRRGLHQLRGRRAVTRAWLIGVLTGFLPCGWLWAFVVSAAGTASPLAGAAVMLAFWLGTVPAMTGVLALGGPVIARLRAKLPAISAAVLIALGLATLATRWADAGTSGVATPHCHRSAP